MSSTSATTTSEGEGARLLLSFLEGSHRCSCNKLLIKNGRMKCDRCRREVPLPLGGDHTSFANLWHVVTVNSNLPETHECKPRQTQFISDLLTPYGKLKLSQESDVGYGATVTSRQSEHIISFPGAMADSVRLQNSGGQWLLETPFGELRVAETPNNDCRLTQAEGRLLFVHTARL